MKKVKPNAANTSPSGSFRNAYLQYLKEQKSKQAAANPSGKKLSEFGAAFASARKSGLKVFEYKGKKYTTEYKDKTKTAQDTQASIKKTQTTPTAEPNNATAKLKEAIRNRDLAKADSLKSGGKTMKYGGKIATPMKGMKTSKSKPCK
jgi:recombinational DNA repair ATPase RecF